MQKRPIPVSKKQVKQVKQKRGNGAMLFFIIVGMVIYIVIAMNWLFSNKIVTQELMYGSIEESANYNALIIRDEDVYTAPFSGIVIPDMYDGDKAKSGSSLATILKNDTKELYEELRKTDLAIINAKKEKLANLNMFAYDINVMDSQVDTILFKLVQYSNINNLSKIQKIKEEIDGLLYKKASLFGSESIQDAYINSLETSKKAIEEQIKSNTGTIVSTQQGTVAYVIDGLEYLKTDDVKTMKIEDFLKLDPKIKSFDGNNAYVENGKPFVRLIKTIDYTIAFVIDNSFMGNLEVGSTLNIKINDINKEITTDVKWLTREDNQTLVGISANRFMIDTASLRKLNIDIIKINHEGLKIPKNSLVNINFEAMTADIFVVKNFKAKKETVKLLGTDEVFAVIEGVRKEGEPEYIDPNVKLYDTYIINPINIEEGQEI